MMPSTPSNAQQVKPTVLVRYNLDDRHVAEFHKQEKDRLKSLMEEMLGPIAFRSLHVTVFSKYVQT